jgi:hypothetical protein
MAYTYGTNGIPIPREKNYLVSLIDEDKILKDIARALKFRVLPIEAVVTSSNNSLIPTPMYPVLNNYLLE